MSVRTVQRIITWLLVSPAVLPLVYADGLLYPYVTLKMLLVRTLGVSVLALFAYLVLSSRPLYWGRLRNIAAWVPATILAVAYVTSLTGIDFYHSFWSTFERGDGLLTMTVVGILFYVTLLCADTTLIRRIVGAVVVVATLVSLYTVLQWVQAIIGVDLPLIEVPRGRFGATLGNAAYLASYLGLTLFLACALAWEHFENVRARTTLRFLYASVGLQLTAILLAATRGTLLALAVVGFTALLYVSWRGFPGIATSLKTYARYSFALMLVASALFFVFREQLKDVPIESVRRLATISLSEGTVSSRFFVWKNVLSETVHSSPVIGYGAEHIDFVFNKIYDPTGIAEEWFDRSHNAFFDYFVQYGIIGFLLYVSLIAALLYRSARIFRQGNPWGAFLFLLAITYVIQNFFVFDTAITFWLILMVFSATYVGDGQIQPFVHTLKIPRLIPTGVALVILTLIIPVSIQPLRANLLLADGYRYHIADPKRSVSSMERGLSLGTYAELEYGYNAYQMYTERQVTMLSGEGRLGAYLFARKILSENYEIYPYDARTAVYFAHVLDLAPPEEPTDEATIRAVLSRAIELSPKRMQPWYLLANTSIRKGDALPQGSAEKRTYYLEGIRVLDEYASTVPKLAEPRFVIATLYLTIGEPDVAREWAAEAVPLYTKDYAVAKRAARFYILMEDWEMARSFLTDAVETSEVPDYPMMYDLAKASFLSGRIGDAARIVESLRTEAPGLVETDVRFIAELEASQ
ncbi:O-antigen ligase family protein [Candidatus Kaiserbacteria bacterium]|nr:O-antigen ligase family protein [Candidatus Kaiserbacteria bacterium]